MNVLLLVSISLVLAFLNTYIIHIVKTKFPKIYFSLGQLIVTDQEDISIAGLITKFFPPVVISIFIGLLSNTNGMELTVLFGFFSSFLVVWPVILTGDELLSWQAKKKINVLYLIYFFYILSYIFLSLLGLLIGKTLKGITVGNFIIDLIDAYSSWSPLMQSVISNIISGIIVTVIAGIFTFIFRALLKKLKTVLIEEQNKVNSDNEDK